MTDTEHQPLHPQFRLLVFLVSIGFFMQGLDSTIVNTALPYMAKSLNESPLDMHNVVVAYVLSVAACIPLSGWLADRYGLKKVFLAAIVIFTFASIGCGLSTGLNELIFYRVIQGIGGAFLLPVGRLAMLKAIPRPQFLAAMSLMSLAGLLGPLVGPVLGGWIVEITTWHWIFLINLPIGIVGALLTLKAMPQITEPSVRQFDYLGFILLVFAMVGISLGVEQVSDKNTALFWSIGLIIIGLIASLFYAFHAYSHPEALFRAKLFKNYSYTIGIIGNFFARLGANSLPFLLPLMLQVGFGLDPLTTGLLMVPMVLGSLVSKPFIRPLIQKLGYRRVLLGNTIIVGAFIASFAFITAETPIWSQVIHFFIFGIFNSLQFVTMNTYTLKDLPQQDASSGNSFLSMIMMVSMSVGVALTGTLINLFSDYFGQAQIDTAFHLTLIVLGISNVITFLIFLKVDRDKIQSV